MEGGGEGMVAIVSNFKDAGLAVTLVDSRYDEPDRRATARRRWLPQARSSVETNTDAVKSHTGTQICDGRYASSYQLAHCSLKPTSPPVHLPEFPLQKTTLSRNKGNFEVGWQYAGEYSYRLGTTQLQRNSFTYTDQGLHSCSRGTDAFIHSLRKYPSLSPDRAPSSDLFCKLLAYTQAKNATKASRRTRSMHKLRDKINPQQSDVKDKVSKNMQTYTRIKVRENVYAVTNEDRSGLQKTRTKKKNILSPLKEENVRYRDNQLNNKYDYLKWASPRRHAKFTEVWYLNEVTRCLKDTIRQICNDRSVCPQIQTRYSRHQTEHHNKRGTQHATTLPICSSSQKTCYCKKPKTCPCETTITTYSDIQPETRTLNKSYDDDFEKLKQIINQWSQTVPIYPNISVEDKAKREEVLNNLISTLNQVKDELSTEDFKDIAKCKIGKCMDSLPMWCPEDRNERNKFKEKFARDLLNKLQSLDLKPHLTRSDNRIKNAPNNIAKSTSNEENDKFNNEISKWLDDIEFKRNSKGQVIDKRNLGVSLSKRLQFVAMDKPSDDVLKSEIVDILNQLPIEIEGNKNKYIDELANKLTNKLKYILVNEVKKTTDKISIDSLENEFKNKVFDYLKNIPELSNLEERKKLAKKHVKKLHELQSQGIDNEIFQQKFHDEIKDWLDLNINKKQDSIDTLSENIIGTSVISVISSSAKQPESNPNDKKKITEDIWNWLKNIPEIEKTDKNKKAAEKLAINISKLHTEGDNVEDKILNEIQLFLENVSGNNSVNTLENKNKATPKQHKHSNTQDDNIQQLILDDISEDVNERNTKISNSKRKNMENEISNVTAKNINSAKSSESEATRSEIGALEKDMSSDRNEAKKLANSFIEKVNNKSPRYFKYFKKSPIFSNTKSSENGLKQSIKEEINDILDEYNNYILSKRELESNLSNILENQIMRGGDVNSIREQLYQILPDDNLSRKDIDNISDRLINLANELTLSSKSYDFTLPSSRVGQESLTPTEITRMQKEIYPNNTKRHIFDFVEETTGISNNSQQARNTNNTTTEQVIKNISDISDPKRIPEKKDNTLKNDGSECLESVPEISRAHQAELVTQLTNRLQSIKTSTPRQSMSIERSFNPKQDIIKLSFSSINNDDQENNFLLTKSQVEKQYMSDLVNVINKWIRKLPISLNNNKVFWETMMKDLAGDIIDKQKYLQLNPEAKISDDVELEHLKYQVFKRLNKILDVNNLSDIITKTGSLMSLVNNIPVPQLAKPIRKRQETKLTQGLMPNYLDALQDEISLWFGDMSSNLYTLIDSRHHEELIKELAEKLKQVFSKGYNESIMDNEISKWLSKVTRNRVDKEHLSKVAQLLKNKLKNKGFTDESSWILKQDSSQFVEENLLSGIFDWLKGQSLYQNRNSQEKRIQENLASTLAKQLKNALECVYILKADINTDEVLTKVIMKYLQTFPMEPEHKTNKNYIRNTAEQLLRYLKDLKLFRNISDKDIRTPDDTLLISDENLIGSLPLNNLDTSTNKSEFDRWKKELMTRLKPLWQQYSKNDAIIKEEIKKNVAKFPIDTTVEKNPKFISDKGGQLLRQLETAPSSSTELSSISKVDSSASNKASHKKSADYLYDSIENWCEKLPINGNTPEDIERIKTLKPYIASKLINKIGELNLNPEIFNDDVLYEDMIQVEIDNLLCTLPPSRELENNKPEIKRSLLVKIKENQKIIRDELAGQAYKRQLHDSILRSLPSTENLSSEEQASFETLKESLADAYINLRYATNNEKKSVQNLFKNKIANEIHRFCDDYLKRHPATPIDSKKLNQELFDALHKVPIPKDEIMKSEVEQVKIKEEINNWIKNLPLLNVSGPKLLQKSKIVNFLTKCLHDIEKEKEIHPDIDYDDKMQKEIKKWLMKLPLSSDKEDEIEDMIKKLMTRLKNTKHSRKLSVSLSEQSIDDDLKEPTIDSYNKTSDKSPEISNNCSHLSHYVHNFPPSTLNTEDKAHMHMIRERNLPSSGKHIPSRFGSSANNSNRDADRAASPLSVDIASQTELRHNGTELYNSKKIQYSSPKISNGSPQIMTISSKVPSTESVGSQVEISPQIIVKEYFWDTTSTTQGSGYKFPQMSISELPCSFIQNNGLSCTSASQRPHEMSWSAGQNQSLSPGPCILLPPPCITQQPSPKAPCVSTQQQTCSYQSQQVPLSSQETPPHLTDVSIDPTPKRVCMRKDLSEPLRQPNLKSTDASRNLSSTERPEVGTSKSFQKENMAHHSSFENTHHSKQCRSQASKAKRSKNVPDDEDFDCSMRFADDVEFWDSSSRRKIYQIPSQDIVEPFIRKTIRKEEKVRCRCQERILTKPVSRKSKQEPCQSYENLWCCSKCRGIHCPHPSRFYFK